MREKCTHLQARIYNILKWSSLVNNNQWHKGQSWEFEFIFDWISHSLGVWFSWSLRGLNKCSGISHFSVTGQRKHKNELSSAVTLAAVYMLFRGWYRFIWSVKHIALLYMHLGSSPRQGRRIHTCWPILPTYLSNHFEGPPHDFDKRKKNTHTSLLFCPSEDCAC